MYVDIVISNVFNLNNFLYFSFFISFIAVPQIVIHRGCIVRDLMSMIDLDLLTFNFLPQMSLNFIP